MGSRRGILGRKVVKDGIKMAQDYSKIFASNEETSDRYQWTDSDYLKGMEVLGNEPFTYRAFNALIREQDEKAKDLNDRITVVSAPTDEIIAKINANNEKIDALNTKASELSDNYKALKKTSDDNAAAIDGIKKSIEDNAAAIKKNADSIAAANKDVADAKDGVDSAKTTADNAEKTTESNRAKIESLQSELDSLIKQATAAINASPSTVLYVQRATAYNKGDIYMMDGAPSWAVFEYDPSIENGKRTAATAPDVSGITYSGQKIQDGEVVWITRNRNFHRCLGAVEFVGANNSAARASIETLEITAMPADGDVLKTASGKTVTFTKNEDQNEGFSFDNSKIYFKSSSTPSSLMSSISYNLGYWLGGGQNVYNAEYTDGKITLTESDEFGVGFRPSIGFTVAGSSLRISTKFTAGKFTDSISVLENGTISYGGIECKDWAVMDGKNGTPDAREAYIRLAGNDSKKVGGIYGSNTVPSSHFPVPNHTHQFSGTTEASGEHTHTFDIKVAIGDATMTHANGDAFAGGRNSSTYNNTYSTESSRAGTHTHKFSGTTQASGNGSDDSIVSIEPRACIVLAVMQVI